MKIKHIIFSALLVISASACTTPKDVVYFQDVQPGSRLHTSDITQITIQPKDELFINVSCSDERLTNMFNLSRPSNNLYGSSSNQASFLGYLVNEQGEIDFPMLGTLKISGMTREGVAQYIKRELQRADLVKDPVVTVNFMNLGVVVLGEVNNPGRVPINRDKLTILDALSLAGDLTINGVRDNVKVIRNEGDVQRVYEMNLCDARSVYSSPVYYLQQEDVIYVEPNKKAIRSSTVNGNTVQTYGFWMSAASFLLSIGVLIFR